MRGTARRLPRYTRNPEDQKPAEAAYRAAMTETMIAAHGKTYLSATEALARIDQLDALNGQLGSSDGRVTETVLIRAAIRTASEAVKRAAARRKRAGDIAASDARKRFTGLYSDESGLVRSIHYIPAGATREHVRYYKTELGFEIGYVRLIAEDAYVIAGG